MNQITMCAMNFDNIVPGIKAHLGGDAKGFDHVLYVIAIHFLLIGRGGSPRQLEP